MQSLGVGGRNSGRILYAYFIAAEFSAKMVCNFPGDDLIALQKFNVILDRFENEFK